jgi:hypothetical protein
LWENIEVKGGPMDFNITDRKAWGENTESGRYSIHWSGNDHVLGNIQAEGGSDFYKTKAEAKKALIKEYELFYLVGGYE